MPSRTIPQVLADAAARDPDGVWVRSDEGTLSFAGALGQVLPDDDYRRFAQLGSDSLDNTLEEAPDEVVITIVEPPSLARDLA